MSNPVPPVDDRLEDLHLYKEIAEHYAKCAISPEALRDWVIAHTAQPVPPAASGEVTDDELTAIYDKANGHAEGKLKPITTLKIFTAMRACLSLAQPVPPSDEWHKAVLHECMMIESCYVEENPAKTVKNLIDWHVLNERNPDGLANASASRYVLKDQIVNAKPEGDGKDAEIRTAGTKMANVCFNLSQQEGAALGIDVCRGLKRLYTQWDAAIASQKAAQ